MTGEYNVNQDIIQPNLVGQLQSGLQAGNQFSEGLLKNYQMRQQLGMTGQLNQLKQQYLNSSDNAEQQGLLNKMMVLDPTSAKTMAEGQQLIGAPLPGTSDLSMIANARYKQLIAAGYPADQAKAQSINDSLASNGVVNALGNFQSKPPLSPVTPYGQLGGQAPQVAPQVAPAGQLGAPLLPVGDQLGGKSSGAETVVNNVPPEKMAIAEHAPNVTPDELQFVKDFANQPPVKQADWYAQNAPAHPSLPPTLTPEVKNQLDIANQHFGKPENIPMGGIVQPANPVNRTVASNDLLNTPLGQAKLTEARATKSVADEADIQKDADNASKNFDTYKNVYNILNNGFKGGALAPYSMDAIKAKQAIGQDITPQEQQYANDYTTLKKMSDIGTGMNIKDMFQRVTNFELGFAEKLRAQPNDMPTNALITTAIQDAADRQKVLKNKLKDQWTDQYGSLAAKSPSGQSFTDAYLNQLDNHPIMTPAYFASKGIPVPVREFGTMNKQQVFDSLPEGSRFIADGKVMIKRTK